MRRAGQCLSPREWTEWLDGEVSRLTAELYQQHVNKCSQCRRKYESLSLAVRSVKELARDDALPAAALHLQVKRRLTWERDSPVRRRLALWWVPAAVALVVSLGLLLRQPDMSGQAQSYIDLYAEIYLQAEGLAANDFVSFSDGRGENP